METQAPLAACTPHVQACTADGQHHCDLVECLPALYGLRVYVWCTCVYASLASTVQHAHESSDVWRIATPTTNMHIRQAVHYPIRFKHKEVYMVRYTSKRSAALATSKLRNKTLARYKRNASSTISSWGVLSVFASDVGGSRFGAGPLMLSRNGKMGQLHMVADACSARDE